VSRETGEKEMTYNPYAPYWPMPPYEAKEKEPNPFKYYRKMQKLLKKMEEEDKKKTETKKKTTAAKPVASTLQLCTFFVFAFPFVGPLYIAGMGYSLQLTMELLKNIVKVN
jgi:hypothetical protein